MPQTETQLEQQFHDAMLHIYEAAKQLKPPYHATRFLRLVNERRGKQAADYLLATAEVSEGFTELFLRGRRLDLSVEYLVLSEPWHQLFSPEQLEVARERLVKHEFDPPPSDAS